MKLQARILIIWAFRVSAPLLLPSAPSGHVESYIHSIMYLSHLLYPGPQIIVFIPLTLSMFPAFLEFMVFQKEQDKETNTHPTSHLDPVFCHFS